eukprot:3564866-Amphidinium_carterae.1
MKTSKDCQDDYKGARHLAPHAPQHAFENATSEMQVRSAVQCHCSYLGAYTVLQVPRLLLACALDGFLQQDIAEKTSATTSFVKMPSAAFDPLRQSRDSTLRAGDTLGSVGKSHLQAST